MMRRTRIRLWPATLWVALLCASPALAQEAGGEASQASSATLVERIEAAVANLTYMHGAGGTVMYFIDVALIVGVAFVLERAVRMRRKRILPGKLLNEAEDLVARGEETTRYSQSTLGKVVNFLAGSGSASRDEREATVNEIASRDIDLHRMMCFPLAAIAGVAPLMGLLGTVAGIRSCFRDVAMAGELGNPAMLAGGIEQALITTIYGLIVAIITLVAYNLFKFRLNLAANELEEVVTSLVSHVKEGSADAT